MWIRLLPYAGWPLAALLFFFWIGLKEDLAQQVELCNQQKLQTVAVAERMARESLQAAFERNLAEREAMLERETAARREAERAADMAADNAEEAQSTIRRLMREAQDDENATIAQVCLGTDIDERILNGLR